MAIVSMKQTEQTQTRSPSGTRVAEARSEDSTIGKTCHQCRQKKSIIVGSCVNIKRDKPCPIKFCPNCLLNRYGENSEEVSLKKDWICPKCRGNCNCSNCMKQRGQKPTGQLANTAKASGYSSVSEFLKTSGSDQYFYKKKTKPEDAAELGLENSTAPKPASVTKSKKNKREELKDINNICSDENASVNSPKRIKISDSVEATEAVKKLFAEGKNQKTLEKVLKGNNIADKTAKTKPVSGKGLKENSIVDKIAKTKPALKKKECQIVEVKLPQGCNSITVSGIELPPEDAGNVFQFLEFCSAFGKALDLRKGQAECVIRELFFGRSKRRQQYSIFIQMIVQLLTVILQDRGETSVSLSASDSTWFTTVGEILSESDIELDNFPPRLFEKGIAGYAKLDSSKRLELLNFLCDETLSTTLLRKCIDNLESVEKKKEAREKLSAAKDKEKQLKQKLQDELAKAVTKKDGAPLSIAEHDAIVSRLNEETKEVNSEIQIALDMLLKIKGSDDVVRTRPVELDDNGLVFWRLKSYNEEPNILLQDLGSWSEGCCKEKWFAFSSEQKPEIEKYISYIRMKKVQAKKNAKTILKSE